MSALNPFSIGATLCLAFFISTVSSAPYHPEHGLEPYYTDSSAGCYYNFQHYDEGDRIITNEPCLNCTCHNRMLMCYLRVCPFTKAIGEECTVEKKPDQCCPVITCPEVPVQLLSATTTAAPEESTDVGHIDNYGCSIDDIFYSDGAQVPSNPHKPCELCYCIRNRTTCVMQECTLQVEGCKPVYQQGICCPVRYDCDYEEDNLETMVKPTPGLIFTTTLQPGGSFDCYHNDEVYADGALIEIEKPCEHCYCMKGEIVCAVQECGTPLENVGKNCTAVPPKEGQCCPDTYECDTETPTTTELYIETTSLKEISPNITENVEQITTQIPDITTVIDQQFTIKEDGEEHRIEYEPTEEPKISENIPSEEQESTKQPLTDYELTKEPHITVDGEKPTPQEQTKIPPELSNTEIITENINESVETEEIPKQDTTEKLEITDILHESVQTEKIPEYEEEVQKPFATTEQSIVLHSTEYENTQKTTEENSEELIEHEKEKLTPHDLNVETTSSYGEEITSELSEIAQTTKSEEKKTDGVSTEEEQEEHQVTEPTKQVTESDDKKIDRVSTEEESLLEEHQVTEPAKEVTEFEEKITDHVSTEEENLLEQHQVTEPTKQVTEFEEKKTDRGSTEEDNLLEEHQVTEPNKQITDFEEKKPDRISTEDENILEEHQVTEPTKHVTESEEMKTDRAPTEEENLLEEHQVTEPTKQISDNKLGITTSVAEEEKTESTTYEGDKQENTEISKSSEEHTTPLTKEEQITEEQILTEEKDTESPIQKPIEHEPTKATEHQTTEEPEILKTELTEESKIPDVEFTEASKSSEIESTEKSKLDEERLTEKSKTPEIETTESSRLPEKESTEASKSPEMESTEESKSSEVESTDESKSQEVGSTEESKSPEIESTDESKSSEIESTEESKSPELEITEESKSPEIESTEESKSPEVESTEESKSPEVESTEQSKFPKIESTEKSTLPEADSTEESKSPETESTEGTKFAEVESTEEELKSSPEPEQITVTESLVKGHNKTYREESEIDETTTLEFITSATLTENEIDEEEPVSRINITPSKTESSSKKPDDKIRTESPIEYTTREKVDYSTEEHSEAGQQVTEQTPSEVHTASEESVNQQTISYEEKEVTPEQGFIESVQVTENSQISSETSATPQNEKQQTDVTDSFTEKVTTKLEITTPTLEIIEQQEITTEDEMKEQDEHKVITTENVQTQKITEIENYEEEIYKTTVDSKYPKLPEIYTTESIHIISEEQQPVMEYLEPVTNKNQEPELSTEGYLTNEKPKEETEKTSEIEQPKVTYPEITESITSSEKPEHLSHDQTNQPEEITISVPQEHLTTKQELEVIPEHTPVPTTEETLIHMVTDEVKTNEIEADDHIMEATTTKSQDTTETEGHVFGDLTQSTIADKFDTQTQERVTEISPTEKEVADQTTEYVPLKHSEYPSAEKEQKPTLDKHITTQDIGHIDHDTESSVSPEVVSQEPTTESDNKTELTETVDMHDIKETESPIKTPQEIVTPSYSSATEFDVTDISLHSEEPTQTIFKEEKKTEQLSTEKSVEIETQTSTDEQSEGSGHDNLPSTEESLQKMPDVISHETQTPEITPEQTQSVPEEISEPVTSANDRESDKTTDISQHEIKTQGPVIESTTSFQEVELETDAVPEDYIKTSSEIPVIKLTEDPLYIVDEEKTEHPTVETEITSEHHEISKITVPENDFETDRTDSTLEETTQIHENEETKKQATEKPDESLTESDEITKSPIDHEETTLFSVDESSLPVVPGEGSCLVEGRTYDNNSLVPSMNPCQTLCRCVSSIVQCESVKCAPPPTNMENCMPIYHSPHSCCPTYTCNFVSHVTEAGFTTETPHKDLEESVTTGFEEIESTTEAMLLESSPVIEVHTTSPNVPVSEDKQEVEITSKVSEAPYEEETASEMSTKESETTSAAEENITADATEQPEEKVTIPVLPSFEHENEATIATISVPSSDIEGTTAPGMSQETEEPHKDLEEHSESVSEPSINIEDTTKLEVSQETEEPYKDLEQHSESVSEPSSDIESTTAPEMSQETEKPHKDLEDQSESVSEPSSDIEDITAPEVSQEAEEPHKDLEEHSESVSEPSSDLENTTAPEVSQEAEEPHKDLEEHSESVSEPSSDLENTTAPEVSQEAEEPHKDLEEHSESVSEPSSDLENTTAPEVSQEAEEPHKDLEEHSESVLNPQTEVSTAIPDQKQTEQVTETVTEYADKVANEITPKEDDMKTTEQSTEKHVEEVTPSILEYDTKTQEEQNVQQTTQHILLVEEEINTIPFEDHILQTTTQEISSSEIDKSGIIDEEPSITEYNSSEKEIKHEITTSVILSSEKSTGEQEEITKPSSEISGDTTSPTTPTEEEKITGPEDVQEYTTVGIIADENIKEPEKTTQYTFNSTTLPNIIKGVELSTTEESKQETIIPEQHIPEKVAENESKVSTTPHDIQESSTILSEYEHPNEVTEESHHLSTDDYSHLTFSEDETTKTQQTKNPEIHATEAIITTTTSFLEKEITTGFENYITEKPIVSEIETERHVTESVTGTEQETFNPEILHITENVPSEPQTEIYTEEPVVSIIGHGVTDKVELTTEEIVKTNIPKEESQSTEPTSDDVPIIESIETTTQHITTVKSEDKHVTISTSEGLTENEKSDVYTTEHIMQEVSGDYQTNIPSQVTEQAIIEEEVKNNEHVSTETIKHEIENEVTEKIAETSSKHYETTVFKEVQKPITEVSITEMSTSHEIEHEVTELLASTEYSATETEEQHTTAEIKHGIEHITTEISGSEEPELDTTVKPYSAEEEGNEIVPIEPEVIHTSTSEHPFTVELPESTSKVSYISEEDISQHTVHEDEETSKPTEVSTTEQPYIPTTSTTVLPHISEEHVPEMPDYNLPNEDYEEDQNAFGPGTCRYGGKIYVSAQQIPRDDPCDFCFCFRSDIICLQQSCPPPIQGCHEEPISGFCCPRYECPVSMALALNLTTTTTTTTTTLPPHFLHHAYRGAAHHEGCQIQGQAYRVGEVVRSASGPCLHCTCGGDGQMKCDPKNCSPQPMLQQMIAGATLRRR